MSLFDDLKAAAQVLDPQFQVSSNEIQGVVSALVHYAEKGDEFLKAAEKGVDDVTNLLSPPAPESTAPAEGSAEAPAPLSDDERAELADLRSQQAARQATANQSTVDHEPGAPPEPPAV